MSNALDRIEYNVIPGGKTTPNLTMFSLSTCGFCRKAQEFLVAQGFGYRYVFLDQLDFDLKREAKQELKARFQNLPVFPVLVIDDKEVLSGFVEEKWAERLGIG